MPYQTPIPIRRFEYFSRLAVQACKGDSSNRSFFLTSSTTTVRKPSCNSCSIIHTSWLSLRAASCLYSTQALRPKAKPNKTTNTPNPRSAHRQHHIQASSILSLNSTKNLFEHTLQKPLNPITHTNRSNSIPMIDIAHKPVNLPDQSSNLLVRLPLEQQILRCQRRRRVRGCGFLE